MVQTIAVSPDGQRAAFSTTGPAAPFNTVVGNDVHGSLVTAADITTLPSSFAVLNMAGETTSRNRRSAADRPGVAAAAAAAYPRGLGGDLPC